MAKSKYTPDRVERIIKAIETKGKDEAGWLAGGIEPSTFYDYQKRYPEFSDRVAKAKRRYEVTRTKDVREKVKRSVEDYAQNGAIETWETTEELFDKDGNLINTKVAKKKVTRPASWAVDKILGKDTDELTSLKKLVESGWIETEKLIAIEKLLTQLNQKVKGIINGDISPEEIN